MKTITNARMIWEAKETKLDYGSGSSQPENFIVFLGAHLHPRFSSLPHCSFHLFYPPPPQCAVASSSTSAETSGSSVKTGKVAVRDSLSALVCWLWRWTLARPRAVILTLPPAFNKEELTQPAERRRHELEGQPDCTRKENKQHPPTHRQGPTGTLIFYTKVARNNC